MYHFEYIDAYQCPTMKLYPQDVYTDEVLNECVLHVCTTLLNLESCCSMKRFGIRSLHTAEYPMLHAIDMYLIVFMVNKSLSRSAFTVASACTEIHQYPVYIHIFYTKRFSMFNLWTHMHQ